MNKRFYIGLLALSLAACGVDDKVADFGDALSLKANKLSSYEWSFGDKVGVSVYDNSSAAIVDNVAYTNTAKSGSAASFSAVETKSTLRWAALGNEGLYYAYAPYSAEVSNGVLPIDLTNQAAATDLLVASGSLSDIEKGFNFKHRLAQVNFDLTVNDDLTQAQLYNLTYSLSDVVATGSYSLLSDQFALASELSSVKGLSISEGTKVATISVILPPQELEKISFFYDASQVGGLDSGFVDGTIAGGALVAGKSYNFSINLSRQSATITGSSITDWVSGGSATVGALQEETEFEIEVGDFILRDGSLVKSDDWQSINPLNPAVGVFYFASKNEGGSYAVSIERSDLVQFATTNTFIPSAVDNNDGRNATDIILHPDLGAQSVDNYPGLKFCHELNPNSEELTEYAGKNGVWYMPSRSEMTSLANEIFTTYVKGTEAILPTLVDGNKTYSESALGVMNAVYVNDYKKEEKIMTSIYHAGGDPFDNYWVRKADGSEDTSWSDDRTRDPQTEIARGAHNELEGFNSIRFSCDRVFDLTLYNDLCMYWLSTAAKPNTSNAFRFQLTRSSGTGATYARGPMGEICTNSRRVRCILRY